MPDRGHVGGADVPAPSFGCLYETAAGWTEMYQYQDAPQVHAAVFHARLSAAVDAVRAGDPELRARLAGQKAYADRFHHVDRQAAAWESFLRGLLDRA